METLQYASKEAVIEAAIGFLEEAGRSYGETLSSPHKTREFLRLRIGAEEREVFTVIYLNNQHQIIAVEDLFHGTLDGAAVYPREVAKLALQHNAAAVIFGHNHPSGVTEPSAADRRITERLCSGLGLLDIRVLDHLIVSEKGSYSFAENGLI
ncbi:MULTISPECIES: JAB domain-containing protein [Halieaceae]|jgi:DNA repair protein RadC|uniref:JAB domain-containing protein n=1 Tax=Halieaceae TaxID=1706372 RepID=UPI000E2E8C34|nr:MULTISPECIES: DNA repair protein RadC [Halieaceae]